MKMRTARLLCSLGVGAVLACARVMAADDTIADPTAIADLPQPEHPTATQPGIWNQPELGGDWSFREKLEDQGFKISPNFTFVALGNPSGGMSHGATANGLFNLQLDLDFEKMTQGAVEGLVFHVNALYAFGSDISRDYVGDFSGISPISTYNSIRLQELWLQKSFFNERLWIRLGNLAIDTDFFLSSSSSLYLNSMICTMVTPMAINNSNFPAYPVASPGLRVKFFPTPCTYVMSGVYGMDIDSNPATNNQHGTRFALASDSGALIVSEAGYQLNQETDDNGLKGTYRVGSFVHTGHNFTWTSQAQAALGAGPLQSGGASFGVYALAEQQIYAGGGRSVSLFVGGGGSPSETAFLAWSMEGGINFSGLIPGREQDVAGVAFARSSVSGAFSNASVSLGGPAFGVQSNIEATYRFQVKPWWYVQPDIQYIINPRATDQIHNAVVLGVSTSIAF